MGKFKDLWHRSKDGERREQRSFLRVVIVATALFVIFLFIKKDNVIRWVQSSLEGRRQQDVIESNETLINELDARIDALTNNRDSLEKYARETYHFAEKGEDVYILKEK